MISKFPKFKKLSLQDKKQIEKFTSVFPPYSDFNFVSLWAWDINNTIRLSVLNNNLVVKFNDYITSEIFYSFIGDNNILDTIQKLLDLSMREGLKKELKLIPFDNFVNSDIHTLNKIYDVTEDHDHNDYIFDTKRIAVLGGSMLHQKKKLLNKFVQLYNYEVIFKSLSHPKIQKEIISFFSIWEQGRSKIRKNTQNELTAIKRLFKLSHLLKITIQCVYVKNMLIGFTIFEVINDEYAVSSFQKGDTSYKGINEFLYNNLATYLEENRCKYINAEQDMGHPGLRRSKLDYRPITFLKKYKIGFKKIA